MKNNKDKELTPLQRLKEMCGNDDKAYFVRWYCELENKRESFEEYSKKFMHSRTKDTTEDWLMEEKVQEAIKYWMSLKHSKNMFELYKTMLDKAMSGDKNSADWVLKYGNDGFASAKENDMKKFLADFKKKQVIGNELE